jgi:hypothetical protein
VGEGKLMDALPNRLTLSWIARVLWMKWRSMARRPLTRAQRVYFLRERLELLLYGWWQQRRGRSFQLPTYDGTMRAQRVTKQIHGIYINFFGRQLWLIVPVTLETVPIEDGEPRT